MKPWVEQGCNNPTPSHGSSRWVLTWTLLKPTSNLYRATQLAYYHIDNSSALDYGECWFASQTTTEEHIRMYDSTYASRYMMSSSAYASY